MIEKLCQIPKKFKTENKSIYDLLQEIGYFENSDFVSKDLLEEYLKNNPETIKEWFFYSEDKRTSQGWYIKEKNKTIAVGYFDNINSTTQEKIFDSLNKACAAFILNEIESIKNR